MTPDTAIPTDWPSIFGSISRLSSACRLIKNETLLKAEDSC